MADRLHKAAITIIMSMLMDTMPEHSLKLIRLMHLVSPSLPIGAFTYSQGLEWAVECDWVTDEESLQQWVHDLMGSAMVSLDLPVLQRLYDACLDDDPAAFAEWTSLLIASRETSELRLEERNRGRAMHALMPQLELEIDEVYLPAITESQLGGFAYAAANWRIPVAEVLSGYLWSWLENMVLAGVKIIPLGQSAGQRVLARVSREIPGCVQRGMRVDENEIGASTPAQAIASCLHETQYTRIYRS
jgi:urease accessory protein